MSRQPADLEIRDLVVRRGGKTVLEVPLLEVFRGDILALLGPNGAGKTTLIHACALLEKPDGGTVRFKGESVDFRRDLTPLRRRMSVVFQNPYLLDTTVFENVAAGLRFRGVEGARVRDRVRDSLAFFGLSALEGRSAKKLSGGEASRVSLARAFVLEPEVLLLDEPFGALDPPTRESLIGDLERMLGRTGATTVFSTHDASEAVRLAGRLAILREGRILQAGPTDEVVNRPADEHIAGFVGVETLLRGKIVEAHDGSLVADVGGGKVEAVGECGAGEEILLCVRPENVTLATAAPAGKISARNVFRGVVTKIIPMGHYVKVRLDCGFPLTSCVTRQSVENLELREGVELSATFKATAVHVIRKAH
jgi:tungstate transport system ATP-binding protein